MGFKGNFEDQVIRFESHKRHPVFYKGILATDLEEKGQTLSKLLDYLHLKTKHIVMFDDDLELLKSVQEECQKRRIRFQGYHYHGAKSKQWNEKLIQFQAAHLIKSGIWLSDAEAKKRMDKST